MLGLRTAIYKVGDLTDAREWYTRVFKTEPYFDEPYYVGYDIGGYESGLLPENNPPEDKPESVLAYWGVEAIDLEFNYFKESGAAVHEKPRNGGVEIVVASVKDPWGNIIGFIYNPEFTLD